jgi:predicted enzyme related to lactoylglutathione lyase
MELPDPSRARAFYSAVLGWRFEIVPGEGDSLVADLSVRVELLRARARTATIVPIYEVSDLEAAVEAVHTAGGTASEPERRGHYFLSAAVDDQGTRFVMAQR